MRVPHRASKNDRTKDYYDPSKARRENTFHHWHHPTKVKLSGNNASSADPEPLSQKYPTAVEEWLRKVMLGLDPS